MTHTNEGTHTQLARGGGGVGSCVVRGWCHLSFLYGIVMGHKQPFAPNTTRRSSVCRREGAVHPHVLDQAVVAPAFGEEAAPNMILVVVVRDHPHAGALLRVLQEEHVVVDVAGREADGPARHVRREQLLLRHRARLVPASAVRPLREDGEHLVAERVVVADDAHERAGVGSVPRRVAHVEPVDDDGGGLLRGRTELAAVVGEVAVSLATPGAVPAHAGPAVGVVVRRGAVPDIDARIHLMCVVRDVIDVVRLQSDVPPEGK